MGQRKPFLAAAEQSQVHLQNIFSSALLDPDTKFAD